MADINKDQERDELHRAIWAIADEFEAVLHKCVINYLDQNNIE